MDLQVGVKALIKNTKGAYLVLRRNKTKYPEVDNLWDIPGGRINPGDPLIANLAREIKEETGLTLLGEPRLIAAQDILKSKHVVRLTYIAEAAPGEPVLDGDEHDTYAWFTPDELRTREGVDYYIREVASNPSIVL